MSLSISGSERRPATAAWRFIMIVVGIVVQLVALLIVLVIVGLTPSLAEAALETRTAVAGTVTWLTTIASFLAALPTAILVRRRLAGSGALALHTGLPAFIISAVNTIPTTVDRGAAAVAAQVVLVTIAAMGAGLLVSLFRGSRPES